MEWSAVELVARRHLNHLAGVHHRDTMADVSYYGQIVTNKQVRQVELLPQVLQQIDDLCLDGHVERRDRFVEDQEPRLHRKGAGDADRLTLSAAELMRIARREIRLERDPAEQLADPLPSRLRSTNPQDHHRLLDDVLNRHTWIERPDRVLKDHLHLPADGSQLLSAQVREFLAIELHAAGGSPVQLQNGEAKR